MNKTMLLAAMGVAMVIAGATGVVAAEQTNTRPPIILLDPPEQGFFSKKLDYRGIPIKAHMVVADEALYAAYDHLALELGNIPVVCSNLVTAGAELHIVGSNQVTSDMPENHHFKGRPFEKNVNIDRRTRGVGGLLTSCGEENLLKSPNDRYRGSDICMHEFAHDIAQYGMPDEIANKFRAQYKNSLAKGLWVGSYAGSDEDEYIAELTMWYFGTHGNLGMRGPKPANGPEGLKAYDPEAFALFDEFYSGRMKIALMEPGWAGETRRAHTTFGALPFKLQEVKLLDSPFKHARDEDAAYLLMLEPDRLLSRFREYAGLKPKAPIYTGWEAESLSGHTLGHYLSACSYTYAATGDERFKERVAYILDELEMCQKAYGNGYVSAIPNGKNLFAEMEKGDIRAKPFDLNGGWSPFYTIHKLMAGLRDSWRYCGFWQAQEMEIKLGDWVRSSTELLTPAQLQEMLKTEYGGMNEVLADLYQDGADLYYLTLSRRFHDKAVLDPLIKGEDDLDGLHANTQIPKLVGLARRYQLFGDTNDLAGAKNFWDIVVKHHTYVTGGNSEGEHFGPADKLSDTLTDKTTETCNTYNMLKLTRLLFEVEPRPEYADYYERALYNHILGSQDPATGMVTYFVPLLGGCVKEYTTPFDTFTCCLGTGMENHAKYEDSIYFHGTNLLYVNLFIPSELKWKEKGVVMRQETQYPNSDKIDFTFTCEQPAELTLKIRCPQWAGQGMRCTVNGKPVEVAAKPGSYADLNRTWHTGDKLEVTIPMALRFEAMPDNPNRVAIFNGPILLAGELGPEKDPKMSDPDYVPVLRTDAASLLKQIKPVKGQTNVFRTEGVGKPHDVTLQPFYRTHHERYSVYWDLVTPQQLAAREAGIAAEQKHLQQLHSLTVDAVTAGDTNSEAGHAMKGEKLEVDQFNNRPYRLSRGGWFSYQLKVPSDKPAALVCTYWGGERPDTRVFDLLVDGEVIGSQTLATNQPGKFFEVTYPIPAKLTSGKSSVEVMLKAQGEKYAGAVFDVRTIRQ
jgi:uncharacterized protein